VMRTYRQDSRTSAQLARGELAAPVAEIRYETDDAIYLDAESYHALLLLRVRLADRPNVLIRGFD
jgi:hypothetical protein